MIIRRNDRVVERIEAGKTWLYDMKTGIRLDLNKTATEIWSLTERYFDDAEIAKEFACIYRLDPSLIQNDVRDALFDFISAGMITSDHSAIFVPHISWDHGNQVAIYFPTERISMIASREFRDTLCQRSVTTYNDLSALTADAAFDTFAYSLGVLNRPYVAHNAQVISAPLPKRVVILPTTACNLSCKYCYAGDPNKQVILMSTEMARAAVDYVVSNSFKLGEPNIAVSFMGGGEPTCNWPVLVETVNYVRDEAKRLAVPSSVTLTTNAVITEEQADWIADNVDFVKVSFDGIRTVQDHQRPLSSGSSYDVAASTLNIFSDKDVDFLVRLTVTNESRPYLYESVQLVLNKFRPRSLIINPVYVCGNCYNGGVGSIEVRPLLQAFEKIQDLGISRGVDIVIPYDKLTYTPGIKTPYCGFENGNCFLTPDGYVSACSEVDNASDIRAPLFFFGRFDQNTGKLTVNESKLAQIHSLGTSPINSCNSCRSNLVCAGPCLVRRLSEKTSFAVATIQRGTPPDSLLQEEAIKVVCQGQPSKQSKLQCGMTEYLSKVQAVRIVETLGQSCELSLIAEPIDLPVQCSAGIHKAVRLSFPA